MDCLKFILKYIIYIIIFCLILFFICDNKLDSGNYITITIVIITFLVIVYYHNGKFEKFSILDDHVSDDNEKASWENTLDPNEALGDNMKNWTNGYNILDTDKWSVPMARPPVCLSNNPPGPIGYDKGTSLLNYDYSRTISGYSVNKSSE